MSGHMLRLVGSLTVVLLAIAFGIWYEASPLQPHVEPQPLTPEERAKQRQAEQAEYERVAREDLKAEPDDPRFQAKLALALLETNGSRIMLSSERLSEGRDLVQRAIEMRPNWWRTKIAKVMLLLAEPTDVDAKAASELALEAVKLKQNQHTSRALGLAYIVDGCALLCRCRSAHHRTFIDPENAVYPEGKEPAGIIQSHMKAAIEQLKHAGKHMHTSIDTMVWEKSGNKTNEAMLLEHLYPYLPLLQLEKLQGGVHFETLFAAAGCAEFEGRRLNGKVCPIKEPAAVAKAKRKKEARKAKQRMQAEEEVKRKKEEAAKARERPRRERFGVLI